MSTVLTLSLLAGFASIVSAITGVAGGVLLLSGLILWVPATAVVPIHGLVQFAAGASRMIAFRHHINWSVVGPFIATMIPGACLGAYGLTFLYEINPSWVLLSIALVIAYTIRPQTTHGTKSRIQRQRHSGLLTLGFACGILGMFVGSTGPIVSSWLLKNGVLKEAHIGSKSVMQGSAHLVKIPLFTIGLNFDFSPHSDAIVGMVVLVFMGTWFGKWCLKRVSKRMFALMTKCILVSIVLKILITEIPKVL
jgi:uncharacterized membrane protein YfcA